jgi:hypothetical protein
MAQDMPLVATRFEPAYHAADRRVLHSEIIRDLPQGVNANEKGARDGLARGRLTGVSYYSSGMRSLFRESHSAKV